MLESRNGQTEVLQEECLWASKKTIKIKGEGNTVTGQLFIHTPAQRASPDSLLCGPWPNLLFGLTTELEPNLYIERYTNVTWSVYISKMLGDSSKCNKHEALAIGSRFHL